ncbi:MAG TPA: tRNA1(Val) (adenine(37)-N6)-methyltransferase [Clostridiaceae bacterium]
MEYIFEDETLDDLQIKGIRIIQKKKTFRFGVDAVLLANFAKVKKNNRVVDMCTGTGIVPLILAGKTQADSICGIELQEDMVEMASRSVLYNKLEAVIKIITGDIKDKEVLKGFPKADVVTVNPPYKPWGTGIHNEDYKEAISRHEICCNLEDVISAARILLKDNGRFYMVHRPERLIDIFKLMREYRIEPKEVQLVHPDVNKSPNIVLIEGQRDGGAFLKWKRPLFVYDLDRDGKKKFSKDINEIYGRDTIEGS